jgi:transcriptional repressor NrdR
VQKILARGEREVSSRDLGEIVMQELKLMDKVAYIRFASVYRSFQDVDDFSDVIRDLDKPSNIRSIKARPNKSRSSKS